MAHQYITRALIIDHMNMIIWLYFTASYFIPGIIYLRPLIITQGVAGLIMDGNPRYGIESCRIKQLAHNI